MPTTARDGNLRCINPRFNRSANCRHMSERPTTFSSTSAATLSNSFSLTSFVSMLDLSTSTVDGNALSPASFCRRISVAIGLSSGHRSRY